MLLQQKLLSLEGIAVSLTLWVRRFTSVLMGGAIYYSTK